MYRTLFYVNIYGSYKRLKTVRFFWPTLYIAVIYRGARYGLRAEPPKTSLSPHRETYWSRIRRLIVRQFQILIVSVVKICKTMSANCFSSVSQTPGLQLPKWKFLDLPLVVISNISWLENVAINDVLPLKAARRDAIADLKCSWSPGTPGT